MITKFKIFESNNKQYIITTIDYKYVFTLGEKNSDMEESTYKLNEISNIGDYKLKFFTSYKDAKEFINFLLIIWNIKILRNNLHILTIKTG